ncbi:MAG: hypothetical protein U1E06_11565, partial [Tabrizicola sp.]|nr:hypothetical protein [Tabrizicola sp.]
MPAKQLSLGSPNCSLPKLLAEISLQARGIGLAELILSAAKVLYVFQFHADAHVCTRHVPWCVPSASASACNR